MISVRRAVATSSNSALPASRGAGLALFVGLLGLAAAGAQVNPPPQPETPPPPVIEVEAPVPAPETPLAAETPEAVQAPEGATIGDIRIVTQSIFDTSKPEENKRLFRLADRLHRTTRPQVIERQLLFRSGEPFSQSALDESERLLRANRYLYEAEIRPVRYEDGRVDLEVVTRDVWTLRAGASVNRAGGVNTFDFSLQDSNFLGTGKDLTIWRNSGIDRDSTLFRYRDPALFGSRTQVEMSVADYSDGGSKRLEVERPFFSLNTRWAAGFKSFFYNRVDSLYDRGHIFQSFEHDRDFMQIYAGLSPGLKDGGTRRWLAGYTFERNQFAYPAGGDSTPLPPDERTLSYPWIGFEYVEDGFVTERQLDQIHRTEDLNLGRQFQVHLGFSTSALGAERDEFVFDSLLRTGWRPSPRQLLLATATGSTRWSDSRGAKNLLVGGRLRYYLRDFGTSVFYVGLEADVAHELDPELQLLLGGDTGLRGYPLRFQGGDRRGLLTVEQRFFSQRELFHLLQLGGAVFFDAGRAWFADPPFPLKKEILRDIGLGLRVGSSRSSGGMMVHLDLAFPLDRDDDIKSVQYLISTSESF